MKRWMIIQVLAISAPAMANVYFTATGGYDGKLQIAYTTTDGDLPRGVALRISCSDDMVVDTRSPVIVDPAFNTFPDWAYSYPQNFQVGNGHPLALATTAGALTADASEFSICMGVLDQTGTQRAGPTSSANLITIQLKGTAMQPTITISGDTFRGPASGVVGSVLQSNLPITVTLSLCPCEPIKSNASIYPDWVRFGKPVCWAFARNCRGDADGLKQGSAALGFSHVFSNDLNILIKAWHVKEPPKGPGIMTIPNGICADFDRQQQGIAVLGYIRVFSNDLNILIANWNIKEPPKGPGVADCMATGHYNYFVQP
jgi:hypothetical protein